MTIVHFIEECGVGGAEMTLFHIVQGLKDRFDIRVWCIRKKGVLAEALEKSGVSVEEVPGRLALFFKLRKERPALLHTHGFTAGIWGRLAGLGCGRMKKIVHVQNT